LKSAINKIVVIEGLDKTGKSTFTNQLGKEYVNRFSSNDLVRFSFPNKTTPIGKSIRTELEAVHPNQSVISAPNFIAEMMHFWMKEIYELDFINKSVMKKNYLFDRYFISTLAYQAFYNDSIANQEFIEEAIGMNKFLKLPTDLIVLDLPNEIIIERTLNDERNNLVDAHDTKDIAILNKRRDAYRKAVDTLDGLGINIQWFDNISLYNTDDLAKELVGKIFD
jgi:thymidylate kinase